MPIYEYRCRECNQTQESFQKVNDPIPGACAACGRNGSLEKLVSNTSFQLKGGGWYSDLYSSTKKESGGKSSTGTTEASAPAAAPEAAPKKAEPLPSA